jgi:hypothetical protein
MVLLVDVLRAACSTSGKRRQPALSLSRLWRRHGKRQEAGQLLSSIQGWFTEGFDMADLRESSIFLDELARRRRPPRALRTRRSARSGP